jgi:hypothetical protein
VSDIGRSISEHRGRVLHTIWIGALALFCFAVVVGLAMTAERDREGTEVLGRTALGLLFLAGGGVLAWSAAQNQSTRVALAEHGLRHEVFGQTTVVRWGEIRSVEILRQGGRVKTLVLNVGERRLTITSGVEGFSAIAEVMVRERLLPRDFHV